MRWTFSQNALPPGATIRQVELKFNRVQVPYVHYSDHASFSLYDVKLPISDPNALKAALTPTNLLLNGTTTTVNDIEVFATSDPVLVGAVQDALTSERYYLTIGVKRIPEQGNGEEDWGIWEFGGGYNCTATLQVWFDPPQYDIQFKNDLDGADFGAINVNGQDYSSGSTVPFYWGDQSTVTAFTGTYQHNSLNWRFQTWTENVPSDNENPKTFTIHAPDPIAAFFTPVFNVTVRNDLEGTEAGQLIYQGNQVNTGYTDQDVFRQDVRSFSAITPQTDGGTTWNFYKWADGPTSLGRNVTVTSSGTYDARFKGHLRSANPMTTGFNGQRKVVLADVWEANNVSHAVYESGGHIWYIRNDGSGWSPERLTDQATTTCRNPSIAATWFATGTIFVHIAWEEQDAVNPNQWNVKYSHSENGGTSWWAPVTLGEGYEPVCGGDFVSMVVWRNSSGLRFRVEPSRSSLEGQVPGTDATAREFSIAGTGNTFWLAFIQGPTNVGGIRAKRIDAWWSMVVLSYPVENPAAQYSWITDCRHANVTATGKTLVSWDAIADGVIGPPPPDPTGPMAAGAANRRVVLAERITTGWAYVSIFSYGNYDNISPSIGLDARPGISKANLLWQWGTNGIAHSSRAIGGYNWSTIVNLDYASAPTLTPYVSRVASIPWRAWTGLSGPPYSIVFTGSEGDGSGSDSPEVKDNPIVSGDSQLGQRVSRQATIRLDSLRFGQSEPGGVTGELIVHCEPFSVVSNGVRTQLDFYSDSTGFQDWLGSVAAVIPRAADSLSGALAIGLMNFQIRNPNVSLNTPISQLTVKVGSATLQGRTILLSDLARLGVADTVVWFQATITAHNLRGKTVALRNRLVGQDVNRDPGWSEMITVDSLGGSLSMNQTSTVQVVTGDLPLTFALHESYPNPFNPSTRINYDLPRPSVVSLIIYDVLGRKITELVDGYQPAGYHSATWNATDDASGIYFARFTVTGAVGKSLYSKTGKLVLMK